MTLENYNRAKQIQEDLRNLDKITFPAGCSTSIVEGLKEWVREQKDKLEKEFEKL